MEEGEEGGKVEVEGRRGVHWRNKNEGIPRSCWNANESPNPLLAN